MKSQDLIVRCMARKEGDVWVAVCLDFSLAAQADSLHEARTKLHAQIADYVREACTVDAKHGAALLTRRAPLWDRLTFAYLSLRRSFGSSFSRVRPKVYCEPLPLQPAAA